MNKKYLIIFVTAILLLIIHPFIKNDGDVLSASISNYSIPRHLEYQFTLWNTTNVVVKDAELWACVPIQETPSQRCIKITTSHPYDMIADNAGNRILHFKFQQVAPFDSKIINVGIDLMVSKTPNSSILGNAISYINEETYCESQDDAIIKLAKRLKSKDVQETARNISKWVSGNIKYSGYSKGIKGARYALEKKEGDCTEFMYLFMALCRVNQIPVRGIGGFVCSQDSLLKPDEYHNWSEFYDGAAWQIADPQKKIFMEDQEKYIAMRYVGISKDAPIGISGLFGFAGEGIKAKMN